jgi:hypothetical protein
VLGPLVVPFGNDDVSLLGVMLNGMGILGALTFSIIQTRCGLSYLNSNKIIAVSSMGMIAVFWFVIDTNLGLLLTVAVIGFINIPILFTA